MFDTQNVTEIAVNKRLHNLVLVQKAGNWLPHELCERQLEKQKTICKLLLELCERKSSLHRIVTGGEKWIYYKNPKRQKAWILPGNAVYLVRLRSHGIPQVTETEWNHHSSSL